MGAKSKLIADNKDLITCTAGVFLCYCLFGMSQEKITRGDYGDEKFVFAQALVFIQCIANLVFAKFASSVVTRPKEDKTPVILYILCSVFYTGAMVASNQALQYISYPTQVLGKACKPIPVMLLGVLLAGKKYNTVKYLCILMITMGVALFMYKDKKAEGSSSVSMGAGELLVLLSLTFDGLIGVTQEKMRSMHTTDKHHMMYNINLYSCGILSLGLIFTGQGMGFISFCSRHPQVLKYLLAYCACSAFGQHFIFLTVTKFGPLTCSVITTTRKFFTILLSVLLFFNPLSNRQWMGTSLVFTGLSLDAFYGKTEKKKVEKQ